MQKPRNLAKRLPFCMLFLAFMMTATFPLMAKPAKLRLGLPALLKRAVKHNDEIKMKDEDVRFAESRLSEVKANMWPSITTTIIVAPINKDVGDPINHTEDRDTYGALFKSYSTIIQPLYGFGKFGYYKTAAKGGIKAEKEQRKMTKNGVIFDVKKYYYSSQMAIQMLDRLNESEEKLVGVVERIDDLLKKESGEVKQEDALKLKVLLQELRQKKELAKKSSKLAVAAVAYKSGIMADVDFNIDSPKLVQETYTAKTLSHYQKLAMKHRPEMLALNAGIKARKNLVHAEKTNRLPMFFFGALLDASDTKDRVRSRQDSPYAYDPYNRVEYGFGVGLKWNLDIWKVNAKIDGLNAEYHKLIKKKALAEKGIPVEVKKAYLEYKEALTNIGLSTKQRKYAKKWFMQSVFAWSFGIGDSREVLESVILKGIADKNYYDSILNHNVAIGALTQTTGIEQLSHLKY